MDTQKEIELFEELLLANPDFDESLLAKDEDSNYEDCEIEHQLGIFQAGIEVAEREARMSVKAQAVLKSPVMAFDEWFKKRHEKSGLYEEALCGKDDATYIKHEMNKAFQAGWKEKQVPESNALLSAAMDAVQKLGSGDFVLVPTKKIKYFSNDGENYEIHDTLAEAKHEAECAIEHFSERLADQLSDPRSDGNFNDVGYGIVLAQSAYSIDHIVTQDDVDNGDYSYEVGTEIMSLFLAEAQEQSHE